MVAACPAYGNHTAAYGTSMCTAYGTAHKHRKRVRLASVPVASLLGQLAIPVTPLTVTQTDPNPPTPPRRQLEESGQLHERVEVTPGGSRAHMLERTTPGGTTRTATYTSPGGWNDRTLAMEKLQQCDKSRAAQARAMRKAGVPAAPQAKRDRVPWGYLNDKWWWGGDAHEEFLSLSKDEQEEEWHLHGGRGAIEWCLV